MTDHNTAVAYFPSQATAESAISALKTAGFQSSQIGVAANSVPTPVIESASADGVRAVSATSENAWEKVKAFFGGDAAEPYAGEATKDIHDDRTIAPDTYGSEDLRGSSSGLSVSDEHARYFGRRVASGKMGAVVTVNAPDRQEETLAMLEENGGDIGDDAEKYEYGTTDTPTATQNIQLYGEVLRVHKDRITSGEIRIRKEVHTTTQTIEVPVSREELVIERVPVSGQQVASGSAFDSKEIRIPLTEERATVDKQAVVREEVRVGKKEVTGLEKFDEQVRSEELKVEQNTLESSKVR